MKASTIKEQSFGDFYHNQLYTLRSEIATYRWHRWLITQSIYDAYFGESRNSLAVLAMKCDRQFKQSLPPRKDGIAGELAEMFLLCQREGIEPSEILGGAA